LFYLNLSQHWFFSEKILMENVTYFTFYFTMFLFYLFIIKIYVNKKVKDIRKFYGIYRITVSNFVTKIVLHFLWDKFRNFVYKFVRYVFALVEDDTFAHS
jgi:hypothetical protein